MLGLFGKKNKKEEVKEPVWPWNEAVLTRKQAQDMIEIAVRMAGLNAQPNKPELPDALSDKVKTMEQLKILNGMWDGAVRLAVAARAGRRH